MSQHRVHTDYLILGSGLAGLFAAVQAADHGTVLVLTKTTVTECNTAYAQGGIACVVDGEDSLDLHVQDTLQAGAGLCKETVVRRIVEDGPKRIADLLRLGIQFTRRKELDGRNEPGDEFSLGKEGGHSQRRILHCGDTTGAEIVRTLLAACRGRSTITVRENHHAIDLITSNRLGWPGPNRCLGAYVLDKTTDTVYTVLSRFVILATGGAGKVYLYTSNPDVACGEGVAMAYRAGAAVSNMEFFQFHPTCLYHPEAKSFLISEAVRGEGGVLKIREKDRLVEFMDDYHEQGCLATRDVVARAIDRELKRTGQPCAYLDITHRSASFLRKRFPNIYRTCQQFGYDMSKQPLPVVPAAHYCCGGVKTDVDGKTCVGNLYAAGEVGCTGLHGANRLASNGLLEALVIAYNVVADSATRYADVDTDHLRDSGSRRIPDWSSGDATDADELIVIYHNWDEIRRFMWDYVGIYRTTKRLQRAKARIRNIQEEIERFYWDFIISADLVELRNLASVAEMIIDCALARHHSIGLHYNIDYPALQPPIPEEQKDNILRRSRVATDSVTENRSNETAT